MATLKVVTIGHSQSQTITIRISGVDFGTHKYTDAIRVAELIKNNKHPLISGPDVYKVYKTLMDQFDKLKRDGIIH